MKTIFLACIGLLFVVNSYAQGVKSFKALNPKVQQGDTLIIQIAAQWMPPVTSNPSIYIFDKHFRPNGQGKVYIGIGIDTPPGIYTATFNENGLRSGWDYEDIEVVEASFEKTRISRYLGQPKPRTDRQKQIIDNVFNSKNQFEPDLTGGIGYVYPLLIAQDVIDPFGSIYENNPYREHRGVDLRAPVGTGVVAVNSGKVILAAKKFRAEGNMLIINHGLGIFSVYMHLSKFLVKEGDTVRRNQKIALSGKSGTGAGRNPHLHFNIKIQDTYVDPLKFISTVNQYLVP